MIEKLMRLQSLINAYTSLPNICLSSVVNTSLPNICLFSVVNTSLPNICLSSVVNPFPHRDTF